MKVTSRLIGIAHLTLLELTPPQLVSVAADAGFDFVGVRVMAATRGETPFPMSPGSPMSRETKTRLQDTGLHVRDIEFLTLDEHANAAAWMPALEAGAALDANIINVVGADADLSRLSDTLTALVEDARAYGIRPALEPISYQPVNTVPGAAELAEASGAAVLIDALHLQRAGGDIGQVRELNPALVPIMQLCDAPARPPKRFDPPIRMPRGMTTNGSVLQVEARASRLIPGTGDLPLADLLAAVPPQTPISVEAPNGNLSATMPAVEYARRNRVAVDHLLDAAG